MRTLARVILFLLSLPLTLLADAQASDWNDFLGPQRNGKSQEKIDIAPWDKTGATSRLASADRHELRGTRRCQWTFVYLRTSRGYGAPHLYGKHNRQRTLAV